MKGGGVAEVAMSPGGGAAAAASSGQISITLASPEETARVRIAVNNPDKVAESVVSHLAKSFPPESVVTIAAEGGGRASNSRGGDAGRDDEDLSTTNTGAGTEDHSPATSRRSPPRGTKPSARASSPSRGPSSPTRGGPGVSGARRPHSPSRSSRRQPKTAPPPPSDSSACYSDSTDYDDDEEDSRRGSPSYESRRGGRRAGPRSYEREADDDEDDSETQQSSSMYHQETPKRGSSHRNRHASENRRAPPPPPPAPPAFPAYKAQEYFKPKQIDYAVPILKGQASVKLVTGSKIAVQPSRCFRVEHDTRGLPRRWEGLNGNKGKWAPANLPGVGVKMQEYAVHPDLVYAVPVTCGQREVVVSDGAVLPVTNNEILMVYYDHLGRAGFSQLGSKRKICPGLTSVGPDGDAGVAHSVKYYMLLDCNDGTKEQFVIPVDGFQTEVASPFSSRGATIPVDRDNITVVFYGKNRMPMYTQLADGSLLAGGLTGISNDDDEPMDESEFFSSLSGEGSVARVRLRNLESGFECVGVGGGNANNNSLRPPSQIGLGPSGGGGPSAAGDLDSVAPSQSNNTISPSLTSSARREIIERRVPVQRVQFVDKNVEVPEIHLVEKLVEVEKIEYQTKVVKKRQVVERPVEHVKYVPKIEKKIVERIIEVPEIIELPREEIIENKVSVDRYVDERKDALVSQTLKPVLRDDYYVGDDSTRLLEDEVECLRLEPELIAVDVFVPKVVRSRLLAIGKGKTVRREVDVPLSHYNSLVTKMNPQFANNYDKLPLIKTNKGSFPLMPAEAKITVNEPTDEEILSLLQASGLVGGSVQQRLQRD